MLAKAQHFRMFSQPQSEEDLLLLCFSFAPLRLCVRFFLFKRDSFRLDALGGFALELRHSNLWNRLNFGSLLSFR